MLEAIGLTKSFKHRIVVDHVSMKVRSGTVVGLLGANGAGKTTTFKMIVGLIGADCGKILLNGEDIGLLPLYRRARLGIAYLPQEPSVFRKLTVEQNIQIILEVLDVTVVERKIRLHRLLNELNIAHLAGVKASSLSGGERRRLEIARALVLYPRFIFLDEPFAGIDPMMISEIQYLIWGLRAKGIGVIVTDHNVTETLQVCDHAYIINSGKILENGSPEKIVGSEKVREYYLGDDFEFIKIPNRRPPDDHRGELSYFM
ncbi:LPS export ABC transporter ATP-binding protein [Thermodesulfobacteriota bacterium]